MAAAGQRWRPVPGGRLEARCGEVLEQAAQEHAWQIVAKKVMPDRVHPLVPVGPTNAPASVVRTFKSAPHACCASFPRCGGSPRCSDRRRTSPLRPATFGSRRWAATSSISGTRWHRETCPRFPDEPDRAAAQRVGGACGSSPTLAGAGSTRYCAPNRKRLGVSGSRSTPGIPATAVKTVGAQHRRTASPKRYFVAPHAVTGPRRPTNTPHITSHGLDWPFTCKPHEKKPTASSRRSRQNRAWNIL